MFPMVKGSTVEEFSRTPVFSLPNKNVSCPSQFIISGGFAGTGKQDSVYL